MIWEIVEEEDTSEPQLKIDVPTFTPKKDDKTKSSDDEDDAATKEDHFLPHGAIAVAEGHLFVASHIDFLEKTLKPLPENQRLATQKEFQQVWGITFGKMGMKQQSSRSFSWTDRAVQPAYELIRQGKMPQSESLLGRALNSLAEPTKNKGPREQRINGSKLPGFDIVGKALRPVHRRHDQRERRLVHQGRAAQQVARYGGLQPDAQARDATSIARKPHSSLARRASTSLCGSGLAGKPLTAFPLWPRTDAGGRRGRGGPRASSPRSA